MVHIPTLQFDYVVTKSPQGGERGDEKQKSLKYHIPGQKLVCIRRYPFKGYYKKNKLLTLYDWMACFLYVGGDYCMYFIQEIVFIV